MFHGDAHVEILTGIGYGFQLLIRCLHVLIAKTRARLSYGIRYGLREDARGMEDHRGVQEVRPERVDLFGKQLRDVRVPQLFPHHRAVLGFCQGMIVGLPAAELGDLDAQLLQQYGDLVIAICRAVLRMESHNDKRKFLQ